MMKRGQPSAARRHQQLRAQYEMSAFWDEKADMKRNKF
jgi:hypothetical protein